MASPGRSSFALFCDDVRVEASGKKIFVGVYGDALIIDGEFPFTLPRFVAHVVLNEDLSEFYGEREVGIFFPGDAPGAPTAVGLIKVDDIRHNANIGQQHQRIRVRIDIVMSNVVLRSAGEIAAAVRRTGVPNLESGTEEIVVLDSIAVYASKDIKGETQERP